MSPTLERRLLQIAVAIAGIVPVGAGGAGVLGWLDRGVPMADSHSRYLSGLLLGIGLAFWSMIPSLERRATVVRALTFVVLVGGLARLGGVIHTGLSQAVILPLVMELGVTPALALWRERVQRRIAP